MSDPAYQPPRSIAPAPKLSGRGLLLLLLAVCLLPLCSLSVYAVLYGRASENQLPVTILIDKRPLPVISATAMMLQDVVVVTSLVDFDITNVTLNINGQYFLYQDEPLAPGETLVVRQAAFATKSSQFWEPGRYAITKVIATGRLPSGARGVTEVQF